MVEHAYPCAMKGWLVIVPADLAAMTSDPLPRQSIAPAAIAMSRM